MEVLSKWILCASLLVCIEAKIEDVYKDCGVTKGCYGFPENCTANSNCSVVMTYTGVEEQVYKVEVAGKGGEGDYVAMGLSLQPAMGNGTVMACTNKGIDSYWNNDDHKNVPQGDQPEISNVTHSLQDGLLICTFHLNATFSVSVNLSLEMDINNPVDKPFNVNYSLNEESYHLMLAAGKLKTDGTIGYHTAGRDVDENPTVLAVFNSHINNGVYTDCASADKGCWGFPDGCTSKVNCTVAVSWVGVAEGTYRVKMTGDSTSTSDGQGYLAVGFSSSGAIGPALAVACLAGGSNGSPVQLYWNTKSKSSSPLEHQNGVNSSHVIVDNNIINCEFELSAQLSGTLPGTNDTFSVDLNINSYHFLLANGPIKSGKIGWHPHKKSNNNTVVLSDYNEFFKKSTSPSPTTTVHPSTTSSSNTNNFYDDCGKSKGCYGHPSGCVSSHSCDMLSTYTKLPDDTFKFELIRPTTSSNTYVAVGLANKNKMADASVMACVVYKDQNKEKFDVSMYWNTATYNSVKLAHPQEGLSDINAKMEDGYLVCTFFRDRNTTITPPGTNNSIEYVLNNSSYYLLLAYGPTKANGIIDYHDNKAASDQPVDLSSFSTVSSSVNLFVKFHGILMALAWMGTANLGMFPARYARSLFPDKKILGKAVWFGIHQILMWLTILLTVAGMTVIIVNKKLNPITSEVLHAMFGLAAVILSLIQPGLAALRCDPGHKHRPVFNWVHRGVGVAALGLATVSIGLAVDLAELPEYTLYVVYVYIAWVAASHCGMTLLTMVEQGRAETAGKGEGGSDAVVKAGLVVFSLGIITLCGVVVGIVAINK